jgi:hypothetical protein
MYDFEIFNIGSVAFMLIDWFHHYIYISGHDLTLSTIYQESKIILRGRHISLLIEASS